MEDFYFAYEYDGEAAARLYRFIGGNFEKFNPIDGKWEPDPEQCKIFIGEDIYYEEISKEQANKIIQVIA